MCEQRVTILSEQGKQEWEGGSTGVRGSTDQLSLDLRKCFPEVEMLEVGLKG